MALVSADVHLRARPLPSPFAKPLARRAPGQYGHFAIIECRCLVSARIRGGIFPNITVVTLAHPNRFFSGGMPILDPDGHGLSSAFIRWQSIRVTEGQGVKRGAVIAEVGATGRAIGAHLDWRMNLLGRRLDPALVAGEMPRQGGIGGVSLPR